MFKACSRCGKVHDTSYRCNANKPKYHYERPETDRLRNTQKWAKKAVDIKEQAQYLCEVCRDKKILNYKNLEVHHIEKLRDKPDMLIEDSNLICLCIKHHKQADRGQLSKDYLRKLALRRIQDNT